jgi:peroxin-1
VSLLFDFSLVQILQAHARKLPISTDVDFDHIADATKGFSGADLQALLYNAHLEVVHATVGEVSTSASSSSGTEDRGDDTPIEYLSFGGPPQNTVMPRAEQLAAQRRVRTSRQLDSNSPLTWFFFFSYVESWLRHNVVAREQIRTS